MLLFIRRDIMKAVFGLLLVALAAVVAVEEVPQSPVYGYHKKEGIPRATFIKAAEERAVEAGAERIVGGSMTDISHTPWKCGLVITILWIFNSVCGASLISHNRAVTAAHCRTDGVVSAQAFTIACGTNSLFSGGSRHNVAVNNVVMHPQWNWNTAANDIAVMQLPTSLSFSHNIQPINLPQGAEMNELFVNEMAIASGFGLTIDNGSIGMNQQKHSAELPVITNAECLFTFPNWVIHSNICTSGAGGVSVCSGDSGGPLALIRNNRPILIGLTSFGSAEGCSLGHPAAFARITSFMPFITSLL